MFIGKSVFDQGLLSGKPKTKTAEIIVLRRQGGVSICG
jgi:hypothetical protein